jgi:hypothetical protein
MKSGRFFSIIAVGLVLASGCSSSTDDGGTGGSAGGGAGAGGVPAAGGSPGTGGVPAAGGSPGTGGVPAAGGSPGAGGSTFTPGVEGDDCSNVPCASPWACCPATNTCTPADFKICSSTVMVLCTKSSECPTGKSCCVTAASTTGSGPSGSMCAASCTGLTDGGVGEFQGFACNYGPIGGKTADCPAPATQWTSCVAVANSPASLGRCTK